MNYRKKFFISYKIKLIPNEDRYQFHLPFHLEGTQIFIPTVKSLGARFGLANIKSDILILNFIAR